MPQLKDSDGKIKVFDNTDTEVFTIPDSSGKTTYTVAATATTTNTAPTTLASVTTGGTTLWGYSTQTQADAITKTLNQVVLDLQTLKVVN